MLPSPKKTTTDSLGESIEPSSILISFLLFTQHFLEDSFVDLASNLSTIGYTIFFSRPRFL